MRVEGGPYRTAEITDMPRPKEFEFTVTLFLDTRDGTVVNSAYEKFVEAFEKLLEDTLLPDREGKKLIDGTVLAVEVTR